ncbi:cation:proton antiporter [Thermodesulfatator atlanticus]
MSLYTLVTFFLCVAVLSGYINYRFLRLPTGIGITIVAAFLAFFVLGLDAFFPAFHVKQHFTTIISRISFEEAVLHWMLGFLLFAGALHVNLENLLERLRTILSLATLGVFLATFFTGIFLHYTAKLFGLDIPLMWAFVFGALISPTDPVAVLSVLQKAGIPRRTEIVIVGESLLNDGVAVVLFLALLEIATATQEISLGHFLAFFAKECLGGLGLGVLLGYLCFLLLRSVDDYELEVLMTLTLVMVCFSVAEKFHFSGPLAVVAAGLLIGNHGRRLAMSERTVEHLDTFWRLVDGLLNAVLFMLIGLEVLLIKYNETNLLFGLVVIFLVLFGRFLSVLISTALTSWFKGLSLKKTAFFTWCGLKGGIAIALAFSLPENPLKDLFLTLTYFNVVFSVIFQGLTLRPIAERMKG